MGEALAEVETDKATMELEAETDGVIAEALFVDGATVPVGAVIAILGAGSARGEPSNTQKAASADTGPIKPPAEVSGLSAGSQRSQTRRRVSPLARRLAAEGGVSLDHVRGSGPAGRIIRRDVMSASQSRETAAERMVVESRSITSPTPSALLLTADIPIDAVIGLQRSLDDHVPAGVSLEALLLKAAAIAFALATGAQEAGIALRADDPSAQPLVRDLGRAGLAAASQAIRSSGSPYGWWTLFSAMQPELRVRNMGFDGPTGATPTSVVPGTIQLVIASARDHVSAVAGTVQNEPRVLCSVLADPQLCDDRTAIEFLRCFTQLVQHPLGIVA